MISPVQGKSVGIWGYGVTGRSAVAFCKEQYASSLHLFDNQPLPSHAQAELHAQGVNLYAPDCFDSFVEACEFIIPSPGIDLRPYPELQSRILPELELFRAAWNKRLIAITGTIGKTTVTHLLTHSLSKEQVPAVMGGNIGMPMLSLLDNAHPDAIALLELSSFQLEHAAPIMPDLAIITNIYPNHLDRHASHEAYSEAKLNLIAEQLPDQKALLPFALRSLVRARYPHRAFAWFSAEDSSAQLADNDLLYTITEGKVVCKTNTKETILGELPATALSFRENWLIIMAARHLLGYEPSYLIDATTILPEHRLAPVGTYREISFYNDSKATIPEATIAAVKKLSPAPTVLFLGGLSKGVDRSSLPQRIAGSVRYCICFGAEAAQLAAWCREAGIPVSAHATLEEAFHRYMIQTAQAGDQVLLSPSGSSFDLFRDYKERGRRFVELVEQLKRS